MASIISNTNVLHEVQPQRPLTFNWRCENKTSYFEYYKEIADGFQRDCEELLTAFAAKKGFSFSAFASAWRECFFSLIFVGHLLKDELNSFVESCFCVIKKFMAASCNVYVRVGALYLIYGIYNKQLGSEKIRIPITVLEYSALLNLVEEMRRSKNQDVVYIFNHLLLNNAFAFVAKSRNYGLEPKFAWQEQVLSSEIFIAEAEKGIIGKIENVLFSESGYSLQHLNEISQVYSAALKEYEEATSKEVALGVQCQAVKDVEALFHDLKKSLGYSEAPVVEKEDIGEKRKALKAKSFASKSDK